jgi:hypothetical protein
MIDVFIGVFGRGFAVSAWKLVVENNVEKLFAFLGLTRRSRVAFTSPLHQLRPRGQGRLSYTFGYGSES